jgi:hypothetical protein
LQFCADGTKSFNLIWHMIFPLNGIQPKSVFYVECNAGISANSPEITGVDSRGYFRLPWGIGRVTTPKYPSSVQCNRKPFHLQAVTLPVLG